MKPTIIQTIRIGPEPKIAVNYAGAGPAVVFLHGIGGNKGNWTGAINALSPRFLAMAWDARGYHESDDYDGILRDEDFVSDLLKVLDHFKIEKAHIVGLSMGVEIAIDFHDKHPERVKSLVFCDGSTGDEVNAKEYLEAYLQSRLAPLKAGIEMKDVVQDWVPSLIADNSSKAVTKEATKSLLVLRKESYVKSLERYAREANRGGKGHKFAKVKVPTLGIVGQHDRLTTPDMMQDLIGLITGAKLKVIKGAAHLPNIEQPDVFNGILTAFLDEQNGSGTPK